MNIKLIVLVLAAGLAGCGVEDEYEPIVEWSGNITEQSERFILSYTWGGSTGVPWPKGSQLPKIEQWWIDVQECAGVIIDISSSPLIIEYTTPEQLPEGFGGWIIFDDSYARVDISDLTGPGTHTRHEMLHKLDYMVTPTGEFDAGHSSVFFEQCRRIVF